MSWSEAMIQAVWEKGKIVGNNDPNVWRKDTCGAWIKRDKYGDESTTYGWQIDHVNPKSNGGSDNISNLQPLQWENNKEKADKLNWSCKVTSNGTENVYK